MKAAREVASKEGLMEMLRQHYHEIPVERLERLQKRSIPFEEERQRDAFMQRIGPAGREILEGNKKILSMEDDLRFSCTACGKCCTRSFSSHVLLDPHDVYLMSRAPGLASVLSPSDSSQTSTTKPGSSELLSRFSTAFSQELGLYATKHGDEVQAPVLMLRGRKIDPGVTSKFAENPTSSSTSPSSSSAKPKKAKEGWCHFAYPETALSGTPIKSYAEFVKLRSEGQVSDADMMGRVRCGFGLDHMPFACSSFPVGELWTSTVKTSKNGDTKKKVHFYWLDEVNCEGVNHPSTMDRPPLRVADYVKTNRTGDRAREWEWFKDVVGLLGRKEYQDKLLERDPSGWAANVFFSLMHTIWYDFDSFRGETASTTTSEAGEWDQIKEQIEKQTAQVIRDLDQLCLSDEWTRPKSEEEAKELQERFMKVFESFLGKMVYSSLLTPETVEMALQQREKLVRGEEESEEGVESDEEDDEDDDEDELTTYAGDAEDVDEDEEEASQEDLEEEEEEEAEADYDSTSLAR